MKDNVKSIISNAEIAKEIYELIFTCGKKAVEAFLPGQFAHVKIPDARELLLRRPFSVSCVDREKLRASVIYRIAGEGTKRLSMVKAGNIDIMLPLGNGFPAGYKKTLLIGGGIGIAPLISAAENYGAQSGAILGFKSKEYAFKAQTFEKTCKKTVILTEDGSMGNKGTVTDALNDFEISEYNAVFSCGPVPMLKAVQNYFKGIKIPVYASLEERMGCGMGGCAVCACKISEDGGFIYKKVCADGPVFELAKAVF